MDIDLEFLTEKFTEIIKYKLNENYSLLFIFYLIQILEINASNYVNHTILTKLKEKMKQPHINTDRHTKFLDKIIEINKDQTKDTYHICDLILNFYVGLSKVWLDYSLCKKDNDRLHERNFT